MIAATEQLEKGAPLASLRDELLELGRKILDEAHDPDAATNLLDQYAGLFGRWHDAEGPGSPSAMLVASELEEIQTVHDAVLAYATALKDATEKSMKGMKQRGRTILAYVDTLPKRVSINKPQKG